MGISLSTSTSTSTRRRTPTHPFPPPPLHPHPMMDYYPPYPAHPPPPSPTVYFPYYNSAPYTVCNHANPSVGHPYYGQFELQPTLPAPPAAAAAKVVNSDVNVHKDTLRVENDEMNPDHYLVSFVFDALVDGSITIGYFAKVDSQARFVPLFPETYIPVKVPFRKGLHQEFRQPSGTGINLHFFSIYDLSNPSNRDDVFPIIISADTCPNPYAFDDRSYHLAQASPQMQITQATISKTHAGHFSAKVIRQLLWSDDICYELRDIYGLGKSDTGVNDGGSGKVCVICLTEPKDTALLPCRHMCMCSGCAKALRLQSNKCPICREIIESLLEIKTSNNNESEIYSLSVIT